ncbi:MAG: hypothetical protein B6I20_08635 [Bacteroidetes bacterium 4572_117]|nr:MAG: hypothetical protein B6I20_08635 [Bacteroidetes bacterium 4572_117]
MENNELCFIKKHNTNNFVKLFASTLLTFVFLTQTITNLLANDTLVYQLKSTKHDSTKIRIYRELGASWKGKQTDTALFYYNKALGLIEKGKKNKQNKYQFAKTHVEIALLYTDIKLADKAKFHDSIALVTARAIDSPEILAKALNIKGIIYYLQGDYGPALNYYNKALNLVKKLGDKRFEAKIYSNMGIIQFMYGNMDSATIYFKRPISIAKKLGDKALLAGAYNNVGQLYYFMGDLSESASNYKKSKEIYIEIQDQTGVLMCENNLGNVYFAKADYLSALESYNTVIEINTSFGDKIELARTYHNMAQVYSRIGALLDATNNLLKSIEIKQKLGDKKGMAADYSFLGNMQANKNHPRKALEYYNKALNIHNKNNFIDGKSTLLSSIGSAYNILGITDSAEVFNERAIEISTSIGDKPNLSDHLSNLAQVYKKTSQYNKAIAYLNKSIELKKPIEDTEGLCNNYYLMANIYNSMATKSVEKADKQNKLEKAIFYATKSFKIAKAKDLINPISNASLELQKAYAASSNYKKALHFSNIHIQTADSLQKLAQTEAATFAEARWQAGKKQQQITFLEKQEKLQNELIASKEAENSKQKAFIFTLVAGLLVLLLSGGLIIYFIQKQRKLRHQQQLNKISSLKLENARNRVSPHFLFNSLNTVQNELGKNTEASQRLNAIVNMLRNSLLNIEKPSITVEQELDFVNNFILLQKAGFITDLQTEINIDKNFYQQKLPAMIMQIPVENAIKHGLAPKNGSNKTLKIEAKQNGAALKISISDNGVGRNAKQNAMPTKGTGTGLKVLSQTLHLLNSRNKEPILFSIIDLKNEENKNCGTKVEIVVVKKSLVIKK